MMRNANGTCNILSDSLGCDTGRVRASIFSPKLRVILGPWAGASYFVTVAEGYHSNDARGVTRSGESPDAPPVTPPTALQRGRASSGQRDPFQQLATGGSECGILPSPIRPKRRPGRLGLRRRVHRVPVLHTYSDHGSICTKQSY